MAIAFSDPTNVKLTGWVGCPVRIPLQFWAALPDDTGAGGVPEDISGWILMLTVKRFLTDSDHAAVYAKDWQIGAGASGATAQEIPAALTADQPAGDLHFDVKAITPTNPEPQFVMGGVITLQMTATLRIAPNVS
jgi:hypothetical protein